MVFLLIMTLWWASSFITHLMKVGSTREYGATKSHLLLMITTLPAGVGVFIYPIAEAVWGELPLLKIVGYTALSLIIGGCWQHSRSWIIFNFAGYFVYKSPSNDLQSNRYSILNRAILTITLIPTRMKRPALRAFFRRDVYVFNLASIEAPATYKISAF